jgi:hypothetical protein
VVNNMPGSLTTPVTPGGTFVTTTNFWTYFNLGVTSSSCISTSSSLTMLGATGLGGGDCRPLARHGVSALIAAAAFPGEFPYPSGTANFTDLYNLIRNTFLQAISSGNCSKCLNLATILANINNLDGPFCGALSKLPQVQTLAAVKASVTDPYVTAYPNPYSTVVNFRFVSPRTGQASLEIYDLLGRRLSVVYSGMVMANIPQTVTYKVSPIQQIPMIYKLSVEGKTAVGRIMPGDRYIINK